VQTFLKAILEEGQDHMTELLTLTPDQLAMVRQSSSAIERQSLAALDFHLNNGKLQLKGNSFHFVVTYIVLISHELGYLELCCNQALVIVLKIK
jgi:hypothetical protein